MNGKTTRKQWFELSLLVSIFVFIVIAVAVGLAILIVYILLKTGAIDSIEGRTNFKDIVLLMLVISVVMGFLITMLTSKLSLKPFTHIKDMLNELSQGNFKVRMRFGNPVGNHPMFRSIETSFNRAAEELDHTEMLRSDFINNFSHEFKTPIVSIVGFAKLLRRGDLSEEQKEEYLAAIEEESLRLSYMANSVLSMTKVENQTILTDVTDFNLSEQIRSALLLLEDKWTAKALEVEMDEGEYIVRANEELMKQVWINLIDNAVKFSDRRGRIYIKMTEGEKTLSVSIANSGKEIPEENLARIFNKFYQADESHSSEGNGIGLAIVKKIVSLHSGDITVESANSLTTFTVTIPYKK